VDTERPLDWKTMTALRLAGETLALPDIRLDKIAIVQSALANGSYRIPTSELASKVIESMVNFMTENDGEPAE
jgi:anti-sigma28 factor (negative regulator of flagellin synthesis)